MHQGGSFNNKHVTFTELSSGLGRKQNPLRWFHSVVIMSIWASLPAELLNNGPLYRPETWLSGGIRAKAWVVARRFHGDYNVHHGL